MRQKITFEDKGIMCELIVANSISRPTLEKWTSCDGLIFLAEKGVSCNMPTTESKKQKYSKADNAIEYELNNTKKVMEIFQTLRSRKKLTANVKTEKHTSKLKQETINQPLVGTFVGGNSSVQQKNAEMEMCESIIKDVLGNNSSSDLDKYEQPTDYLQLEMGEGSSDNSETEINVAITEDASRTSENDIKVSVMKSVRNKTKNKKNHTDLILGGGINTNEHSEDTGEEKPHKCQHCPKAFNTSTDLKQHLHSHSSLKRFSCLYCEKQFAYKTNYENHLRIHTGERPFHCEKCAKSFKERKSLTTHVKTVHEKLRLHHCDKCGKNFSIRHGLKMHMKLHDDIKKTQKCEICLKYFATASTLRLHQRTHTGEKPFCCEICLRRYNTSYALRQHITAIHERQKPFKCEECGKCFGYPGSLTEHMQLSHPAHASNYTPYSCNKCGRSFKQVSKFTAHVRTHDEPAVEQTMLTNCERCGNSDKLVILAKNDCYEKSQCNECGTVTIISTSLDKTGRFRKRKKIRSQCHICGKVISSNQNLKKHLLVHAGIKNYPCQLCKKAFSTSSNLEEHMRIHRNEYPYMCEQCGRGFRQKHCLVTHMKLHIMDAPSASEQNVNIKQFRSKNMPEIDTNVQVHSEEMEQELGDKRSYSSRKYLIPSEPSPSSKYFELL